MIIWEEYRWVVYAAIVIFIVILLDEYAYRSWKVANPGHMYSHLKDNTPPLDPSKPPYTIIYDK